MTDTATVGVAAAERREIVDVARELGRRELLPRALELDERRPGALDTAWERVTEVGFDRAMLAPEHGGVGLDPGTLLLCLEELATGEGGVAMLALLSNAALAALPPQRAAHIPSGERWAIVPAPPAELATGARVEVALNGESASLSGRLSPALGALDAAALLVVTGEPDTAVVSLRTDGEGVEVSASDPQLGLRSAAAADVSLSGATAEIVLPAADAGDAAARSLALLRAGTAAIARGVARRAQEMALSYAETRMQGGVPIIEHDAVRDMLAAMAVRLSGSRCPSAAPAAADALPADTEWTGPAVLATKVEATDAAVISTTDAVQVFGGTGYMHETGIEKLMRDAKQLQLWPEPNWVARQLVAASLSRPG